MNGRHFTGLCLLVALFCRNASCVETARPDWVGIWSIWGGENYQRPWLKGSVIALSWKNVEPKDGQFNFSSLDRAITKVCSTGQRYLVKVYVEDCPEWLYEKGVPKVLIDYSGRRNGIQESWQPTTFPYYLDATYKKHLVRMWDAIQKHIAALPLEKRNAFVGFQVPLGRSGDPQPFPGSAMNAEFDIDSRGEAWALYQVEMAEAFIRRLKANGLYRSDFYPLFNLTDEAANVVAEKKLSINRKSVVLAQGYQLNNEMKYIDEIRDLLFSKQPDGSGYVRCRGEFDEPVKNKSPWLEAAPQWHYYWQCLWMLTYGLDMFNIRPQSFKNGDDDFAYGFNFFNERAGYKDPRSAKFAYVAFRDGLDVADTTRFPEGRFGAMGKLEFRFQKVIETMAPCGARLDDPDAVTEKATFPFLLKRKAMNDAGFNIWPGNYGLYLNQIDPNVHDQGYWRVGSKEEPFGRFARGFDLKSGKDRIYLDVEDRMFDEASLKGKETVKIRVVYYDGGTGKWGLFYDSTRGPKPQLAFEVENGNSGTWKEKTILVKDAYFGNRGPKGSDIMLVGLNQTDSVFHMVDVEFLGRE